MKNKKERDILSINILYDYKDELEDLIESEDFNQLLLDEAINTIKNALNKNTNAILAKY